MEKNLLGKILGSLKDKRDMEKACSIPTVP